MQERYLGDSHDFIKYALLRHLTKELQITLGVNWYLTCPSQVDKLGNNDGEKRHHLKGGVWESTDPELFQKIDVFSDPSKRKLNVMENTGILPSTTEYVTAPTLSDDRGHWHTSALSKLVQAGLIFIDPDNGLEITSMSKKSKPKYALYDEVADYFQRGQQVISIQFARQCNPIQRADDVRRRLMEVCGAKSIMPVVRGRTAPNVLFVSVVHDNVAERFGASLQKFGQNCAKTELVI